MNPKKQLPIRTPEGTFFAEYTERGLAGLRFPKAQFVGSIRTPATIPLPMRLWHRQTTAAVNAMLAGRTPTELPPLDDSCGTEFQRAVWKALRNIKSGYTRSYGQVARAIGKPKAVRAVGGACGANPIPLLVPCHRVLAANRKIGGFSGGLGWKQRLLEREGVTVAN